MIEMSVHHEMASHDQLQATLEVAGLDMHASEVHGLVCGEICRQLRTGPDAGFSALLGVAPDTESESEKTVLSAVGDLMNRSREALDSGVNFSLVLPGDEADVDERTGALAGWARGFALGLLHGDKLKLEDLQGNSAEIVQDFLKISEAQAGGDPDEDERALTELEEYMRVGVQLVFEELHPDSQGGVSGKSVH